jgi:hypothetical protein
MCRVHIGNAGVARFDLALTLGLDIFIVLAVTLTCLRHSPLRMFSINNRTVPDYAFTHNHLKHQVSTSNQKAAFVPRILVGQVQTVLHRPLLPILRLPATEQQRCPAGI